MIITVSFEPLLRVYVKYTLQFDEFFGKKVYDEYPTAIDSDSIEPLSILHSKLKFEW